MRVRKINREDFLYEVCDLNKDRWWTAMQSDNGWFITNSRGIPVSPDKQLGRKIISAISTRYGKEPETAA